MWHPAGPHGVRAVALQKGEREYEPAVPVPAQTEILPLVAVPCTLKRVKVARTVLNTT